MIIGLLKVDLHLYNSGSLKDKRMVLKSLADRIRRQFNVAIAEIDNQDKWQSSTLGTVTINSDSRHANRTLSNVVNFIENSRQAEIVKYEIEML